MNYQHDPRYGFIDDAFGGGALAAEPDALTAAYARALGAQGPVNQPGGGFRGMVAPTRRRAATRDEPMGLGAPAASRRRGASKRPDPSALSGGFAALNILNEQMANPAS
nr:hypothetical protein [Pandoravirus massiliensis]